jgi:MFS family permease
VKDLFPVEHRRPTVWRGTREGLSYARRNKTVRIVLLMMIVFASISFNFNILLPVLVKLTLHGHPLMFGLISAAFGAGALLGALASAAVARATWRVLFLGAAGFGVSELLIAPLTNVYAVGALLFVCGVFFTSYTSNSNAAIQLESPDYIRGRVLGLYYYAWNGLAPIGALIVGLLVDTGGTRLAFAVAGASALAVTGLGAVAVKRPQRPARPALQAEPAGEQLAA